MINNGYDNEDFDIRPNSYDKFTLTYTGSLYNGLRDPKIIFLAIKQLIDEKKIDKHKIQINYLGKEGDLFLKIAKDAEVDYIVNNKGFCNRNESIREQMSSNILLLLGVDSEKDEGVYTGKVFEYIGSKKPILFIGGKNNALKELLERNNIGKCYSYSDIKAVKECILDKYNLYTNNIEPILSGCADFSYQKIIEKLITIIEEI